MIFVRLFGLLVLLCDCRFWLLYDGSSALDLAAN